MRKRGNKYVVYDDDGYIVIISRMKNVCLTHVRHMREKLVRK